MRITHLSTYDMSGGAARSAYRLHTGLRSLGHESRLLTLYKVSSDPTVIQFIPPDDISTRFRRGLRRRFLEQVGGEVGARGTGATLFSDDRSQHGADAIRQLPATDVLNLHWVAGFIDYESFFLRVPRGLPVAWTLHDMNPFTGGCHFDGGCGRHALQCGQCPQLESSDSNDLSSQIWSRKRSAYSKTFAHALHLVAPSRWISDEAKKSSLFAGFPSTVIPYGVDTDLFQPRDKGQAREQLKIPQESSVVLFVADAVGERRKGFRLLAEAVQSLKYVPDLYFLAVGRGASSVDLGPRVVTLDYIEDENRLSLVYSAADVFVVPSLQDNLPNTVLEALACGVPTVAFDVGGLRDIIQEGKSGHLVPAGDIHALRATIAQMLENPEQRAMMAGECRGRALAEYGLDIQASRYAALYRALAGIP